MEQVNSAYFPIELNMDLDVSKLNPSQSPFLKNTRFLLNTNANNSNGSGNNASVGSNVGKITNIMSTSLAGQLSLPDGTNKTIGVYEFQDLNEGYWFVWNSNGEHTVNRHDGNTGILETVYKWNCAEDGFSINPEHAIPEHRCHVKIRYKVQIDENGETTINNKIIFEKELIFTNAKNDIFQINVLASIGSNSFTTPYYAPVYPHYELRCDLIALAPIAPLYSPAWTLVERIEATENGLGTGHTIDKDLPNKLFNHAIQLSYQFVYTDARPSSVSMYSLPIIVGGTDCAEQNPETQPRCADVRLWVGNAHVEKINIFTREAPDGSWTLYDTIKKFDCDDTDKYWERDINSQWSDFAYNKATNEITYRFCNNKQCTPVDQALFTHIENNVPFACKALAPAGDALLLGNDLRDSNNLPCEIVDSFSANITLQPNDACAIEKRKIVMYVLIKNDSVDKDGNGEEPQFLFGDSSTSSNTSIGGGYRFGGLGMRNKLCDGTMTPKVAIDDSWKDYEQYVPESTGGFVGYLAGTNFQAISKQVKFNFGSCTEEDFGIVFRDITKMNNKNGSFDDIVKALVSGEYIFLQKFVFEDIPSGKYVFRVAGHRTGTDVGYELTSTYIRGNDNIGVCDDRVKEFPDFIAPLKNTFEWTIDVCTTGYNSLDDSGSVMVLIDNTLPDFETLTQEVCNNVIDYNLITELYLYEDNSYSVPMEMQRLNYHVGTVKKFGAGVVPWTDTVLMGDPLLPCGIFPFNYKQSIGLRDGTTDTQLTDHNGFVFHRERFWRWRTGYSLLCILIDFTAFHGEPVLGKYSVSYVDECEIVDTDQFQIGKPQVTPAVTVFSNKGYKGLKGSIKKSLNIDSKKCDRVLIKGRLVDQNGKALTGITVGYEQSQFVRTDGFGGFKAYVHNSVPGFDRCDHLIISNSGGACQIVCVGCFSCCSLLYKEVCLPGCTVCENIIVDEGTIVFQKVNQPDKGLKGRYGIAVEGWDYYGRIVTGGVNLIKYFDVNECWSKHPILSWVYSGGQLPKEIKWLTFSLTANLNGSITQWVADKFQLLDSEGNVTSNKGTAQAVAVNIASLIHYNSSHNFNTLSTYQFVRGDVLKIIDDCDNPIQYLISGTTFGTTATTASQESTLTLSNSAGTATSKTNFATDNGSTIIIPYDSQIDDLLSKCAIKIEIVRPYQCENNLNPFGEQWQSVPVIDGVPQVTSGDIPAFDVFKIYRNIGKIKDCTQNPNDDPYFSNNVTDFWGAKVTSWGRVLSENPYAERKWKENEIAKSHEWINNGVVNGLATFWNENVKNYKGQDWGGIVSIHAERNALIVITSRDWFTAPYEYNYLRQTNDGLIQSTLSDNLGDPMMKIGDNFGCKQEHTSTIIYYEGLVYWFDGNNSNLIVCDYKQANDVSINSFKGWLLSKNKFISEFNYGVEDLTKIFEVQAGFDPMHNEYHLTFRLRPNGFLNEHREIVIDDSETFVLNTQSKQASNFRGYVPEYYSKLRNANDSSQFILFKDGQPYQLNNLTGTRNTFFGVKQTSVVEICVNANDSKEKIFQSLTQECLPTNFFVDKITTPEKNSFSYVPQKYWVRKENTFYAEVLRDMSSYFDANFMKVSTLIEGKRVFGKYALIRFVMIEANQDTYFELNKIWCLLTGSELSEKPQIEGK